MQPTKFSNILFIQQLNTNRIKLRELLDQHRQINSNNLIQILLKLQLIMYQNKNVISMDNQLVKNTINILRIIHWEYQFGQNYHQNDDIKFNVNFQEQFSQLVQNQHDAKYINGIDNIMVEQKNQRFESFKSQIKQPQTKNTNITKIQVQKLKPIQFISANNLPKGTSIRKKFVPPYKKQQKQQNIKIKQKQFIGENKQDQDNFDDRYINLQAKLVQIIQSQIVQKDKKVQWSQIAGLGFAKKIIHQMIVWPMLRPDIFTGLRAPPKGILLFGPPGTGKTMIGRAIASQAHATFFSISASSITSKWVGQSQKLVKTLFAIARVKQPSVIFIDQIDSILCSRKEGEQQSSRRIKTQFLIELDGTKSSGEEKILIIGATNLPEELDDAVRRRFVKRLYIPLPNFQGRKQLISTLTDNILFDIGQAEKNRIAELTKGFSGADMYSLCSQASYVPLRALNSQIQTIHTSQVPVIKFEHFIEALKLVRSSVNQTVLKGFQFWNKQYGSYQLSPDELEKQQQS